jgi:uncharacterized protein YndB with AHSA1/START domain
MNKAARQVEHGSFTIERHYDYAPAKVFAAWSHPDAKAKWFTGPANLWTQLIREQDFRVGGREHVRGRFSEGNKVSDFQAVYHDIIPDQRIVYVYEMQVNDVRMSVSVATITFAADGKGTKLTVTEQGVFLDEFHGDGSGRESGTRGLLDRLEAALDSAS